MYRVSTELKLPGMGPQDGRWITESITITFHSRICYFYVRYLSSSDTRFSSPLAEITLCILPHLRPSFQSFIQKKMALEKNPGRATPLRCPLQVIGRRFTASSSTGNAGKVNTMLNTLLFLIILEMQVTLYWSYAFYLHTFKLFYASNTERLKLCDRFFFLFCAISDTSSPLSCVVSRCYWKPVLWHCPHPIPDMCSSHCLLLIPLLLPYLQLSFVIFISIFSFFILQKMMKLSYLQLKWYNIMKILQLLLLFPLLLQLLRWDTF